MWDLPGPGLEPLSPALAGGFLITAPPGKPRTSSLLNLQAPSLKQQLLRERLLKENHTLSNIPPTWKDPFTHESPQPTLSQMTNGENTEKVNYLAYVCPQIISVLRLAGIFLDPSFFCLPNCRPSGNDTSISSIMKTDYTQI